MLGNRKDDGVGWTSEPIELSHCLILVLSPPDASLSSASSVLVDLVMKCFVEVASLSSSVRLVCQVVLARV